MACRPRGTTIIDDANVIHRFKSSAPSRTTAETLTTWPNPAMNCLTLRVVGVQATSSAASMPTERSASAVDTVMLCKRLAMASTFTIIQLLRGTPQSFVDVPNEKSLLEVAPPANIDVQRHRRRWGGRSTA